MRGAPLIIGLCIGVLAAALLFAHQWSSEEVVVATPEPSVAAAGPKPADRAHEPARAFEQHQAPTTAGETVVERPVVENVATDAPVNAVPMVEQSPYLGESRELDYAERLLTEPRVAMNRVESAKDVFDRCLDAHPGLERCMKGKAAAESLIGQARTGAVQLTIADPSTAPRVPAKSLQVAPPNIRIPRPKP